MSSGSSSTTSPSTSSGSSTTKSPSSSTYGK
jgi:hypothetical protein